MAALGSLSAGGLASAGYLDDVGPRIEDALDLSRQRLKGLPLLCHVGVVCRLEVKVAGLARFDAEYRAAVGPLDAPRLVKGATFACQASPALPDRVRVWLHANPNARDLTGRYLDFSPARSGRRRSDAWPVLTGPSAPPTMTPGACDVAAATVQSNRDGVFHGSAGTQ